MNRTQKQILLLVGGLGTRLGDITLNKPKPLLDVAGRPFLNYLIEKAVRSGFRDIILLAGYNGDQVESLWGQNSRPAAELMRDDIRIFVNAETSLQGTAGALLQVREQLHDQFFLANGDSFFDFDWSDLTKLDTADNWLGRIALREISDGARYGSIELEKERIAGFLPNGRPGPATINGGVYLLRRGIVDLISRTPMSLEKEIFPSLANSGRLFGKVYRGFFIDIGIPEDLARAQLLMSEYGPTA